MTELKVSNVAGTLKRCDQQLPGITQDGQMSGDAPRYWLVKKSQYAETLYDIGGRKSLVASRKGEAIARRFAADTRSLVVEVSEFGFAALLFQIWPQIRWLTFTESFDGTSIRMLNIDLDSLVGQFKANENNATELWSLQSLRVAQRLREVLVENDQNLTLTRRHVSNGPDSRT